MADLTLREIVDALLKIAETGTEREEKRRWQDQLFYVKTLSPDKEIGDGKIEIRTVLYEKPKVSGQQEPEIVYCKSEIVCTGPDEQAKPYICPFDEADRTALLPVCKELITLSEKRSEDVEYSSAFFETKHGFRVEATIDPTGNPRSRPRIIVKIGSITITQPSDRDLETLHQFLGAVKFPVVTEQRGP